MSSLPTTSHLSVTPQSSKRTHRHRRSAAISGDFDVMGLGVFSPPPSLSRNAGPSSSPMPSPSQMSAGSLHQKLYLSLFITQPSLASLAIDDDLLNKHFHFSNDEDFTNKPTKVDFEFPNKTPDLVHASASSTPRFMLSPVRNNLGHSNNLNSPIRLKTKKSSLSVGSQTPRFFLTEETVLNSDNVPDAVIDLDEILNANLHIGDGGESRSALFREGNFGEQTDDFLASPFSKPLSMLNQLTGSPYTNPAYFKQGLREPTTAAIEEEEIEEFKLGDEDLTEGHHSDMTAIPDTELLVSETDLEAFANPQDAFPGIYSNFSANSSNASLPSTSLSAQRVPSTVLIEKTCSNSSRESSTSAYFPHVAGTPTNKRSSAKANRYQSFYDQSFKISHALKYSSTESIHLIRSNSGSGHSGRDEPPVIPSTSSKILGHSSSLPSLKSNGKRSVPLRYSDMRPKRDIRQLSPPPNLTAKPAAHEYLSKTPATTLLSQQTVSMDSPLKVISVNNHDSHTLNKQRNVMSLLAAGKNESYSPVSLNSITSLAIVSNDDVSKISSSSLSPVLAPACPTEESIASGGVPIIVVSVEKNASSLPYPTGKDSPLASPQPKSEREFVSKEEPMECVARRTLSPTEENILNSTRIPKRLLASNSKPGADKTTHKPKLNEISREKPRYNHPKSRSLSMIRPGLEIDPEDDTRSVKSSRRKSGRFTSWFRRKD